MRGVVFINTKNRLFLFWQIGKCVFETHKDIENIAFKISNFYSYKYGLDYTFSVENINRMKCFYLCFPVYNSYLEKLSWEQYLELIEIEDRDKRLFYFKTSIFCNFSLEELIFGIDNFYYERI